jgi:hypothetical protein
MGAHFGFSLDAKTAGYTASLNNYSAASNLDPMYGIGIVNGIPLKETLSLRLEGQYNTATTFTDASAVKTNITMYPLQVSLQNNVGLLYFGGGINYTLWTFSAGGTSANENNGFGYQAYAGLNTLFFGDLELKYTYMTSSVSAFGATFGQAASTISIGTKIWII